MIPFDTEQLGDTAVLVGFPLLRAGSVAHTQVTRVQPSTPPT